MQFFLIPPESIRAVIVAAELRLARVLLRRGRVGVYILFAS